MTRCNIILLEDNKIHRNALTEDLQEEYGHIVKSFRDLDTFQRACDDASISHGFDANLTTIVLMDIMMSFKFAETESSSPRFSTQPNDTDIEKAFCDDNLGLTIANDIRCGRYTSMANDVPILFFTGRQMDHVTSEIDSDMMQPSLYLEKPAWIDEVQDMIEKLLKMQR